MGREGNFNRDRMRSFTALLMILLCIGSLHAVAQDEPASEHDFTFVRLQYDTAATGYYSYRYGSWSIDHPAADLNFLRGVIRLTSIRADPEPVVLRLDDDRIFSYPFIYGLEMGQSGGIVLSDKEIENLREFLLRGGFLFIDDFWGTYEWERFYRTFSRVFPDRKMQELHSDHPIFHSFYDIDGPQMIPDVGNRYNYPEEDVAEASNHVILDDHGRVMVLINWNSDIGDGWEHTYHPDYPTEYANLAYQLGINYLVYALTH
ncbi:MAG: DUF4159 domain-containing protein [Pseudomonadales bacterium]|nr:DUF4159 domain-containing protein [Pseudomonadales bacterium]